MPVDLYVGGAEHAVLHLLYARFWHKVLYDCGLVSTLEPFQSLCNQGLVTARSYRSAKDGYVAETDVYQEKNEYFYKKTGEKLASQIEKMSKSKLNGMSPDDIIDQFGADALRLYEMFMAPIEKEKIWVTESINGCYRLLSRFYDLAHSEKLSDHESAEALKVTHQLIKGVQHDIEAMQFNTAVSKLMIFINDFSKLEQYPKSLVLKAVQCLYPFAPHVCYEIWEILGQKTELAKETFPNWDEKFLIEESATYVVQINGKLRGRFELPLNQSEEVIVAKAKENPNIAKYLEQEIVKVVFVPNKLLNFVVR